MPNRGELGIPARRPSTTAAATPADAWSIICFCTLGSLMTLYMAISTGGIGVVPRLLAQFPWG